MTDTLRTARPLPASASLTTSRPTRILRLAAGVLAFSLCAALAPEMTSQAYAQQPTRPGQRAEVPDQLLRQVEDFYHFATIGNYEAARALGRQIIAAQPDPEQVLDAFVEVHARRGPRAVDLDRRLLDWQNTEPVAEISRELVELINEGRRQRATDPTFISEQIERLARGTQAYRNAMVQLRNSGEYAVPIMIQVLRDPDRGELHSFVRQALRDLEVDALNPLVAATRMDDDQLLPSILLILGDIGYREAAPYLLEALQTHSSQSVQDAARQALRRLNVDPRTPAADAYRQLAEAFYEQRAMIRPSARLQRASVWHWEGGQIGLSRVDVPQEIFDEVMAMRAAGRALALGEGQQEALALWLAANYRREGELPEGGVDHTRPEDSHDADYYGAQAGVPYLLAVLERAQRDRTGLPPERRYNTADVSLRAIKSLQQVIGRSNLEPGESPLTLAMNFPDRRVRIEAAFTLAQALPREGFSGQEQVVPILADALSQTGEPTVVVVMANRDEMATVAQQLNTAGYQAVTASGVTDALEQAQALPGVDVVIIDHQIGDREVDNLLAAADASPRLSGAVKLVLTRTAQSRYEALKDANPTLATTTARSGEALLSTMEDARRRIGGLPLDQQVATELATRSGELLIHVGLSDSVFNLEEGQDFLLAALDDARPEIQMLTGDVVALLSTSEAQQALLQKALEDDVPDEVRVSLFRSLASSAKNHGNQLGSGEIDALLRTAADGRNLEVQAAAAEAVGALSLPADQARRLIVEETRAAEDRGR